MFNKSGFPIRLGAIVALWTLSNFVASAAPPGAAVLVEKEKEVAAQVAGTQWKPAPVGIELAVRDKLKTGEFSRAAVRFTDLSVLRIDELTAIEISPPVDNKQALDVKKGGAYFFSREKPGELEIRTPAANGALRGTEFAVRVTADGKTTLTMFEGEVELSNARGRVLLKSGEQGVAEIGRAPRKTAVIEASNIIQWCLYYPAVLDPADLNLSTEDRRTFAKSLAAYQAGDLLGALAAHPFAIHGGSVDARLFRAAIILSSGQVDKARAVLEKTPRDHPARRALEQMIAAVKFQQWTRPGPPRTASEWMAESYYRQSRGDLEAALHAARTAMNLSPELGFAWARVAELEFSFGRTLKAMKLVEHGLELAPRNAQAVALQGFLLSAENRTGAARRCFDEAIALDGALGNAWLGRGLTFIRQNHQQEGRRDLQTAAALEPNRSLLRSYLGKAFSQVGYNAKANRELDRAIEIDPRDPTPWLYSAIQRKQENRYNEAVDDLEKSVALNDNRSVFRSRFLLDQDRAVRGTNLAAIYLNDGLVEQSVREAVRAVASDYTSAPAHLFLANSYSALRDPSRVLLRYETGWFNELLLSNLLSPVGGGPLSQFVTEEEYSKLFERDKLGISSVTEYFSNGEVRETGSQYGTAGNVSYALDAEYRFNDGIRPNNRISRFETYGTFKLQLGPQDTVFFQTKFGDLRTGNVFPYYDPRDVSSRLLESPDDPSRKIRVVNRAALTSDFHQRQDPAELLLGWHHEWNPGNHTLLLLGRLANRQARTELETGSLVAHRDVSLLAPADWDVNVGDTIPRDAVFFAEAGRLLRKGSIERLSTANFDSDYRAGFETYGAELQHILTLGPDTVVLGGRYQRGTFDTRVLLTNYNNNPLSGDVELLTNPPANQDVTADLERVNLYLYDLWKVTPWLTLVGGLTYDRLHYPDNFRNLPVNDRQADIEHVSPKAGMILQPWRGATLRAAYSEAISGVSFDESVRLEPTQVAGFLQAYRTLASEALVGSVAGSRYRLSGVSLEQKLPTRTYLGIECNLLEQNLDRTLGVFDRLIDHGIVLAILPSSLAERGNYREESLTATLNQLLGDYWAIGTRYRYTHSRLERQYPEVDAAARATQDAALAESLARSSRSRSEAGLHELSLYALFNHPTGFFARAEANWYQQENDEFITGATLGAPDALGISHAQFHTRNAGLAGEDFWQFNVLAGFRFYRNQCEVSAGVLNITGEDYRLNPLNPYTELVRDRTFVVRCRVNF